MLGMYLNSGVSTFNMNATTTTMMTMLSMVVFPPAWLFMANLEKGGRRKWKKWENSYQAISNQMYIVDGINNFLLFYFNFELLCIYIHRHDIKQQACHIIMFSS
jgi:hypothetical protein